MAYTTDSQGYLLDDVTGERVKDASGNEIKVEGVMTQKVFEDQLNKRLGREKDAHKKAIEELIKKHEQQLANTTSKEDAENLRAEITKLENQVLSSEEIAAKRATEARSEQEIETKKYQELADNRLNMYKQERFKNTLTALAVGAGFKDPADAVAYLKPNSFWEENTDEEGKKTGELSLKFRVNVVEKEGEDPVERVVGADKAISVLATDKPYLLRSKEPRGSGTHHGGEPGKTNQDFEDGTNARTRMAAGYGSGT